MADPSTPRAPRSPWPLSHRAFRTPFSSQLILLSHRLQSPHLLVSLLQPTACVASLEPCPVGPLARPRARSPCSQRSSVVPLRGLPRSCTSAPLAVWTLKRDTLHESVCTMNDGQWVDV